MDATTTKETAIEVCKVLDRLTALSVDLSCHRGGPAGRVVLSADKVHDSCRTINEAVVSLKRILSIAEENGGGLIPPDQMDRLEAAGD
ncbi:MAG TPA: hypothetical protein VFC24_03925 [Casimicrobiaceae bacterium]|nr:hypothetical protein [Casimicrobiaceae bacterium]